MNTKITPGPWHVGQKQAHRIVYDSKGWAVCDCTVYHGQEDAEEMKANAALIAAAPELLEALKLLVYRIECKEDGDEIGPEDIAEANAAIPVGSTEGAAMSKRDIQTVCELAAHLMQVGLISGMQKRAIPGLLEAPGAEKCAADAMRLQRLGRRARNNARKRWLPPGLRSTVPGYDVQPYLQECARIGGEVARVVSPYGWHPRDFVVGTDGITFLCLPGRNAAVFGTGFLI